MSPLLMKTSFQGRVEQLLLNADRNSGLEKAPVGGFKLSFAGIEGDCHSGLTRKSDSRTLPLYDRNTDIRNVRQLTIVSMSELAEVAQKMGIPALRAEWLGANMAVSGIPEFTLLPPSTRLQFASGATLVIDMENMPCRYVADVISKHHPDQGPGFVKAAEHKRGVTAWVEREGNVDPGDAITVWLPQQRIYGHA